jgi:hypothetical protein
VVCSHLGESFGGGWQPGAGVAGKFRDDLGVMDAVNKILAGALGVEMSETFGNALESGEASTQNAPAGRRSKIS